MIISKLVVGNVLVFQNEKTKSNLNIKFIKRLLKSNIEFIIVENPKLK